MNLYDQIANDVPALRRGQVWCLHCGTTLGVNAGQCLAYGWPECCGETMTIDAPEEADQR